MLPFIVFKSDFSIDEIMMHVCEAIDACVDTAILGSMDGKVS